MASEGADLDAALEASGCARARDLPGQYLSAGMKKRLALARLKLSARPLWLMDEPLAALDVKAKALAARDDRRALRPWRHGHRRHP